MTIPRTAPCRADIRCDNAAERHHETSVGESAADSIAGSRPGQGGGASGEAGKPRKGSAIDKPATNADRGDSLPGEDTQLLLTPVQAARTLSVGRTTLYGLLADGVLASVQIGRCRRIPYASVRSYVENLIIQPAWPADPSAMPARVSRPSAKMRGREADAGPAGTASVTVEALSLPFAAEDQAADQVEATGREV